MKALLFYQSSELGITEIEIEQLERRLADKQILINKIDLESRRGVEMAETYDIMVAPALILLREDGVPQAVWQNELPSDNQLQSAVGFI